MKKKFFNPGWLPNVNRIFSENFNRRPESTDVSMIVIHSISLPPGRYGGNFVLKFFTNCLDFDSDPYFDSLRNLKVSPHIFIDRKGTITQFVNLNDRAWHAGKSIWKDRRDCNNFSIGIELEGVETSSFENEQYKALLEVIEGIKTCKTKGTRNFDIVGHSDIAPGRKSDPGPFFLWDKIG